MWSSATVPAHSNVQRIGQRKHRFFLILRNVILHSTLGSYSPRPLSLSSYLISHIMHMESGLTALAQRSVFGGGVWGNPYLYFVTSIAFGKSWFGRPWASSPPWWHCPPPWKERARDTTSLITWTSSLTTNSRTLSLTILARQMGRHAFERNFTSLLWVKWFPPSEMLVTHSTSHHTWTEGTFRLPKAWLGYEEIFCMCDREITLRVFPGNWTPQRSGVWPAHQLLWIPDCLSGDWQPHVLLVLPSHRNYHYLAPQNQNFQQF